MTWKVEISHDGPWPTTWVWRVVRRESEPIEFDLRSGYAWTKDGARRRAVKARRSMESEDVKTVESV